MSAPRKPRPKGPPKIDPETMRAIESAAEKAAKRATTRAVRDVMLALGIDARTPTAVLEHQSDSAFLRRVRLASESRPAKFGFAIFSAVLSLIGGLVALILKAAFFGNAQ